MQHTQRKKQLHLLSMVLSVSQERCFSGGRQGRSFILVTPCLFFPLPFFIHIAVFKKGGRGEEILHHSQLYFFLPLSIHPTNSACVFFSLCEFCPPPCSFAILLPTHLPLCDFCVRALDTHHGCLPFALIK